MDPVWIPLIAAAIQTAGHVLVALSKSGSSEYHAGDEKLAAGTESYPIRDDSFLKDIISRSSRDLSILINCVRLQVREEMMLRSAGEAIQDVEARIKALRQLIGAGSFQNQEIHYHLVISALNPLHVSLEIARVRLTSSGIADAWRYLHMVGTAALVSGYAFLGQDRVDLLRELEIAVKDLQTEMLNELAPIIIGSTHRFPWDQVPKLLSFEGVGELSSMYESYMSAKTQKDVDYDSTERNTAIHSERISLMGLLEAMVQLWISSLPVFLRNALIKNKKKQKNVK